MYYIVYHEQAPTPRTLAKSPTPSLRKRGVNTHVDRAGRPHSLALAQPQEDLHGEFVRAH
jgi:hypothetical protein